jgi:chromosome segregation ATPase
MPDQAKSTQELGVYNDRSQRSLAEESKLRKELERITLHISHVEGGLADLEKDKLKIARSIAVGERDRFDQRHLDECIRRLNETRDSLKAYQEARAGIEQAIAKCSPTPEQIQARRALQTEFTKLAADRLKKTREVERLLQQLRQALQERVEVAEKMRKVAEALECEISGDGLDESRFEGCLASLPDNLLSASERWHEVIIGGRNK